MGDKGGQADNSGMMQAMVSAQEAAKLYALGEEQLQWSKDVWNQEQPLVDASQQAQIDYSTQLSKSLTQMQMEAQQQWQEYNDTYKPLEEQYAGEAANWDSPSAIAEARGQAMGDVAEQGMAGLGTAAETLRAYGVNPSSPRYASMYVTAQPMLGAAEAAAGTSAADRLRMEKMGLQAGAINTGRGMVNTTGSLTQSGSGAGSAGAGAASGAGQTAFGNIGATGVGANAATGLFNAGTGAMNTYVNAVDGYNSAQADFAKAASAGMGGFGSALGTIGGALIGHFEDGGGVRRYADGGDVTPAMPLSPQEQNLYDYHIHNLNSPGGVDNPDGSRSTVLQTSMDADGRTYNIPTVRDSRILSPQDAMAAAKRDGLDRYPSYDSPSQAEARYQQMHPQMDRDVREYKARPLITGGRAKYALGGGIPSLPMQPPSESTSGGGVPAYASASGGKITDDVPAQLNVGEYVVDKAAAQWMGHKTLAGMVDKARKEIAMHQQRPDVGGEPTMAIPQRPTFVSRPMNAAGAIPGMA